MNYGETLYNLADQILNLRSDCIDEKTKKQCEALLESFNESFNREKATKFLKKYLYDKMNDSRYIEILRDSSNRTYRDIRSAFENNCSIKSWPSRNTIIKICFDFFDGEELLQEVDGVRLLDALFDNMYLDRLNLKNKNDLCYYFFLVNPCVRENRSYECTKKFIEDLPEVHNSDTNKGRRFTQEVREEVDSIDSVDNFLKFINNYINKCCLTVKYTAKKEFVDEFNRIVNQINDKNPHFRLKDNDKSNDMDNDKSFLALLTRLSDFLNIVDLSNEQDWLKIIFASFISERSNGEVDRRNVTLMRKSTKDEKKKLNGDNKRNFREFNSALPVTSENYNLEEYIFKGNLSRGMYLFFAIYEADYLVNNEQIGSVYSYKKFINEKLDRAGFSALNDGILLDKIVMDLIDYCFEENVDIILYLDCVFRCIIETYDSRD